MDSGLAHMDTVAPGEQTTLVPMGDRARPTEHAELVQAGCRWLRGRRCKLVLPEFGTWGTSESADVIGWRVGCRGAVSLLVECKVSRADFFADAKKPFRVDPAKGMGELRYYLTPAGLLGRTELPPRWGLVEHRGGRSRLIVQAERVPAFNRQAEVTALVQALRRQRANDPAWPDKAIVEPMRTA